MIVWGCACFTRNSVRLAIRKIMYAPSKQGEQPSVEVSKEFIMSPNKLHLEASLDKELYYHGETIAVNVHIQNNSNKSVKKVKVSGEEKVFQSDWNWLFQHQCIFLSDARAFKINLFSSHLFVLSISFIISLFFVVHSTHISMYKGAFLVNILIFSSSLQCASLLIYAFSQQRSTSAR